MSRVSESLLLVARCIQFLQRLCLDHPLYIDMYIYIYARAKFACVSWIPKGAFKNVMLHTVIVPVDSDEAMELCLKKIISKIKDLGDTSKVT